jgi:hypothetical protein
MNIRIPPLSETMQGLLLILAGAILILHVTGIITSSLNTIIFLGGLIMLVYGLIKIDFLNRLKNLGKKR